MPQITDDDKVIQHFLQKTEQQLIDEFEEKEDFKLENSMIAPTGVVKCSPDIDLYVVKGEKELNTFSYLEIQGHCIVALRKNNNIIIYSNWETYNQKMERKMHKFKTQINKQKIKDAELIKSDKQPVGLTKEIKHMIEKDKIKKVLKQHELNQLTAQEL